MSTDIRSGRPETEPAAGSVRATLTRRTATLAVAGFLVVLLTAVAALLPVPYVMLSPGLTANTIGEFKGETLIVIEGRETYPTAGRLDLTTVTVNGGPGRRVSLVAALHGWLDPDRAVVPVEQVYPGGQTREQIRQRNAEEMSLSQDNATAAAMRALDVPIEGVVVVQAVTADAPATDVLRAGDIVRSVDGEPVETPQDVRDAVAAREPGDPVTLVVERDGETVTETLSTTPSPDDPDRPLVGILPAESFDFPFPVEIQVEEIGGPSAGLMFALGIVDKLTPDPINAGRHVAGTGTITPDGDVGAIGGIQQKLVAAHEQGADLFLAPAGNCAEVRLATPEGLPVARVATLDDALAALAALREGDLTGVPTCAAA